MANPILSAAFATPAAYIKSSEQSAFPASNVGDYTHPHRPWKAANNVSGTTHIGIDLGVNTDIVSVVVDDINLTSVKFQGSTDNATWSATQTVTVGKDRRDGRYKCFLDVTTWTVRYVRILSNTGTTTDGSLTMRLGSLVLLTSAAPLTRGLAFPVGVTPLQAVQANTDFAGGGREPAILGNRYMQQQFTQPAMPLDGQNDILDVLALGEGRPLLYFRNDGDATQVSIGFRVGAASIEQTGPNSVRLSSLLVEECV